MNEKYVIDGYSFETINEAKIAKNEIDGIEYLKQKINYKNPKGVLDIYHKAIEKQLFKTPIGYSFLRELQQFLIKSPEIDDEDIGSIPVITTLGKENKLKEKHISIIPAEKEKKYKNRMMNMIILNVFLVIVIILIVIITNNSSNTNILNYRDRLEREYQEKEDELAIWDRELKEKEESLRNQENNMQ